MNILALAPFILLCLDDDHLHDPARTVIYTLLQEIEERESGSAGVSEFSPIGAVMNAPVSAPLTSHIHVDLPYLST